MISNKWAMFQTLPKIVKRAFWIAFASVLLIELILKRILAPSDFIFSSGEIFLKLCYSITASTIFFFINQHIPKEEKKIRTYIYQHHKINLLYREVEVMLWRLGVSTSNVTKLDNGVSYSIDDFIVQRCMAIIGTDPMKAPGEKINVFPSWFEYFSWKYQRLTELFNDLMIIEDSIDKNTLNELLILQTSISFFRRDHFPPIILPNMAVDLFSYALPMIALHRSALLALESFEALPDLYVGKNSKARMPSFAEA